VTAAERVRRSAALLLALALIAALCATGVSAGQPGAAGAGAQSAKKKGCKKKKPKSAAAAKKKKCKKKKPAPVPAPAPGPSGPLVRASMTWEPANRDVDLHVFDASGNHAGTVILGPSESIPGTTHSYEVGAGGPETFREDTAPGSRTLTFYACVQNLFIGAATATITAQITDPGGTTRTVNTTATSDNPWKQLAVSPPSAAPFDPGDPSAYCQVF